MGQHAVTGEFIWGLQSLMLRPQLSTSSSCPSPSPCREFCPALRGLQLPSALPSQGLAVRWSRLPSRTQALGAHLVWKNRATGQACQEEGQEAGSLDPRAQCHRAVWLAVLVSCCPTVRFRTCCGVGGPVSVAFMGASGGGGGAKPPPLCPNSFPRRWWRRQDGR